MSVREAIARQPAHGISWHGEPPHLNKLRWLTAFKAAISAIIAIGLAMGFGWDRPYWAGISVIVVTLPYVGASLEKGAMRLAGTALAGIFVYLISGAFPQNQAGYCALLFLVLVFTGYFGTGAWYPYAFILCGMSVAIIGANTFQTFDKLWEIVYFRVSEICLGVLVAIVVNALVFPQSASKVLGARTGDLLEDFTRLLENAISQYTGDKPTLDDPQQFEEEISSRFPKLRELLPQAVLDSSSFSRHRYALKAGMQFMERMFVCIVSTQRAASARYPRHYQENFREELRAYTDALLDNIHALAATFARRQPLPKPTLPAVRQALEDKLDAMRRKEIPLKYRLEDTTQFLAFYANLCELERAIELLRDVAGSFLQPGSSDRELKARIMAQEKSRFRLDPARLKHGIKVGIAVITAIYAWLWWQYPGGLQGVVTVGIVMQLTVVASNQKSLLRLGGCLIGGTCGALILQLITPHVSTYLEFAPFLFACFFLFGFLYYGPKKYAYAGLQAMIVFLLMTSIENTQSTSLKPGIDRFLGILAGVGICAVVLRLIWPVIPERELRRTVSGFFGDCRDYLRLYTPRHLAGEKVIPAEKSLESQLIDLPATCQNWISQIGLRNEEEPQRARYHELALSLQSLRFRLQSLEICYRRQLVPALLARIEPDILALNQRLAESFDAFEAAFRTGRLPETFPDLAPPLRNLNRALWVLLRRDRAARPHSAEEVAVFLALVRRYRSLTAETRTCRELLGKLDLKILERSPFF